jgi:hypothetical protein
VGRVLQNASTYEVWRLTVKVAMDFTTLRLVIEEQDLH